MSSTASYLIISPFYKKCSSISSNQSIRGIFPKSYVRVVESELTKNGYTIKRSDFVKEVTFILRDWREHIKEYFLTNDNRQSPLRLKILELHKLRSQILSGTLPVDELREVKLEATSVIDTGNSMLGKGYHMFCPSIVFICKLFILGLDMIVRDDFGNVLDISQTSTTKLYEEHAKASKRIRNANVKFILYLIFSCFSILNFLAISYRPPRKTAFRTLSTNPPTICSSPFTPSFAKSKKTPIFCCPFTMDRRSEPSLKTTSSNGAVMAWPWTVTITVCCSPTSAVKI